ncbi:MAG TPA: universal stress protein [Solirubrobacteraceae bacterium]
MTTKVIVSYDGTDNDRDALALGRLFADAGASVALAYVRHAQASEQGREELEQHESLHRLERGAAELGRPDTELHVVISASTSNGLRALADREQADIVVFGSEYRTARGHVAPGTSAQRMLDGGSVAIAVAPVGLRDRVDARIATVAVSPVSTDDSARETARSVAGATGASVVESSTPDLGLLVVGSRPEAAVGRVLVSASAERVIENATCPVLVVPRSRMLHFGTPVTIDGPVVTA